MTKITRSLIYEHRHASPHAPCEAQNRNYILASKKAFRYFTFISYANYSFDLTCAQGLNKFIDRFKMFKC